MKIEKEQRLQTVEFSIQERWEASKTRVHQNKKKYNRKKDPFYFRKHVS